MHCGCESCQRYHQWVYLAKKGEGDKVCQVVNESHAACVLTPKVQASPAFHLPHAVNTSSRCGKLLQPFPDAVLYLFPPPRIKRSRTGCASVSFSVDVPISLPSSRVSLTHLHHRWPSFMTGVSKSNAAFAVYFVRCCGDVAYL